MNIPCYLTRAFPIDIRCASNLVLCKQHCNFAHLGRTNTKSGIMRQKIGAPVIWIVGTKLPVTGSDLHSGPQMGGLVPELLPTLDKTAEFRQGKRKGSHQHRMVRPCMVFCGGR